MPVTPVVANIGIKVQVCPAGKGLGIGETVAERVCASQDSG